MADLLVEQALYFVDSPAPAPRLLARSAGLGADHTAAGERICAAFGRRPAAVTWSEVLCARLFDRRTVCLLRVHAEGETGLLFHLVLVPRVVYEALGADPFLLADRLPLPVGWRNGSIVPALILSTAVPPARTVEQLRQVLQRDDGPTLLGAAQALVDGSRLVLKQQEPAPEFVRALWLLLPDRVRARTWLTTFLPAAELAFDVVVTPSPAERVLGEYPGYVFAEQAADYPEGYYELNFQIAVEGGDEAQVARLLARRNRSEVWCYALWFVLACLVMTVILARLDGPRQSVDAPPVSTKKNPP